MKSKYVIVLACLSLLALVSCGPSGKDLKNDTESDTVNTEDSLSAVEDSLTEQGDTTAVVKKAEDLPEILVYNFHVTNRCPSCIAIEDVTTKTLKTYFAAEVKRGQIKQFIVNVDEEKNAKLAEKYQVFGSGLFITRVFKGKETTADLTGDGFKYARKKEEEFTHIVKSKIQEFLK